VPVKSVERELDPDLPTAHWRVIAPVAQAATMNRATDVLADGDDHLGQSPPYSAASPSRRTPPLPPHPAVLERRQERSVRIAESRQ
jgi:hypothetical protein